MATVREYAYYWEGNRVAIVERDTAFDNDPNSVHPIDVLVKFRETVFLVYFRYVPFLRWTSYFL